MLRVSLVGNLGADPESRFSQKGTQLVSFRVAVNQVRTGPDGERQENTEWFRVRVNNRLADFAQRLTKGTRVLVVGRLDVGRYQSRDGEMRTSFDVWADEVQSMGPRPFGPESDSAQESETETPEPVGAGVASPGVSSLGNADAGPRAGANGRTARGGQGRGDANRAGGEELEDLPF